MTALLGGKYVLDHRLGGGGMAEVFLGHTVGAEGFTRKVAIKRVLAGYSENPRFAKMFVSEAQLSARLQHPNIVSVLDFDRDPDRRLFLVMEHVDGPDLDALLETGNLSVPVIIYVMAEVLRGLGYAHDLPSGTDGVRGIVHRDISPHNVLLSWEGAVKVSDFGIAKARAASNVTASEMVKGKPAYMSPEQANGDALDGRSDLFAVGVMMWEMLCGRQLFSGDTTQETLSRLMFAPIPRPSELRANLPEDLDRVTMKLLARERENRFPTAQAVIDALIGCADHPRSGRELLTSMLSERFERRAIVRPAEANEIATVASGPAIGRLPGPLDRPRSGSAEAATIPGKTPARHAAAAISDASTKVPGASRWLLVVIALVAVGIAIAIYVAIR